ncbi:hypothetical protein Q5P01_009398 [Channa striata]|uniref:RELT-like protein 2 n=1 Tax=Channa striata TaxID=64152 RepID=A0AA88N6Q2_CHASR|nr:hypothetical protein Q5P01_009398 [Channa striata]
MTDLEASGVGEHPPSYMIFLVVFLFFITGLLGFLICHLLKKKGYRCRTGDMDDEEEEEEKIGVNADDDDEENQDTVEQILKCIIENEANMEAFNEMLGKHNICARHDPRLRKESIGSIPPHLHTVHSGTDLNSCHLCAQIRSKKGRRQSRTPRLKRAGEQTVFSVGRFRVTHTDKKLHGGNNPLASSGDQLDQSQDSEERKDGGYNLRSMFKDPRPSSEITNGVAPNVGKRRKSLTIFGLRRGSDPVGIKSAEVTGRDPGGVRFAVQQQPVVLEEPVQAENKEISSEHETKSGSNRETEHSQNQLSVPAQLKAKAAGSVNSTSAQNENQACDSVPDGSKYGYSPEPSTNPTVKSSIGSMATAPSSLLIPSSTWSGQTFNTKNKQADKVFNEELCDPGPLQTSTPIVPMPGSVPGFTSVIPAAQHEPSSSPTFPVTQTPPDLSSSLDLEPGFGTSLALISLGSSPPTSFPIKTASSVSSLKTPTSPLVATPSPKLSSKSTASEAALTPSPKLLSGRVMSSQSLIPSSSFGKGDGPLQAQTPSPTLSTSSKLNTMPISSKTPSSSPADQIPSYRSSPQVTIKPEGTSGTFVITGDVVSSPLSLKHQEIEHKIPRTTQKTEIKRVGILKTANLPPVEGDLKGSTYSYPSVQLSTDRMSSLPVSPSSPLSPSSPVGSRISNVTIVKASPDSKREFSVVTMVEDEEQKREISDPVLESGETEISPGVGQGGEVSALGTALPESLREGSCEAEGGLMKQQDKCDMMEMEDIRDCKVTQVHEGEKVEEEVEKMLKQD